MNLPPGPLKIIYADPPWSFNNKNTGGSMTSGAANQYDVMTIDDICALPVKDIADQDCVLAMWWVASQPIEALKVVDAWGFKLKTMTGFNWEKITKHGSPFFGMGYWTRAGSECCLIATKGKAKPASRSVRSVERAVVEKHSKKPDVFRYKLEMLCGDVPRIELFARQEYDGWSAWGNEL
ncbi:MAG: MT-A70 family methyltransferase [Pseudomonadota bacterium]